MMITVDKQHLVGEIWYRSLDPVTKRRQTLTEKSFTEMDKNNSKLIENGSSQLTK